MKQSQPINFVVAFSGGVDSHVLLHYLHQRVKGTPHQLAAIHVHHGLSPKADAWLEHCSKVCHSMGIPFESVELTLNVGKGDSVEAVAREARYRAIGQYTECSDVIVLGQHRDDQLETFLLQLRRGAGPKGLSGMAAEFTRHQRRFIRPFVSVSQQDIVNYAQVHQLQWVEDDSNQDTRFERNFLRHQVLPLLNGRWPQFAEAVERSAGLCAEQQELLEEEAHSRLNACLDSATRLKGSQLSTYSPLWQKQILRCWFAQLGVALPSAAVMEQILTQFLLSAEDATPEIALNGWWLRRYQHMWILERDEQDLQLSSVVWKPDLEVALPQNRVLVIGKGTVADAESSKQLYIHPEEDRVEIRFGGLSQKFKPKGELLSRTLKHWFKLWSIPPWRRQQIPLIYIEQQLVAVGDIAISESVVERPEAEVFVVKILQQGSI